VPKNISIAEIDLCVIIGNLLDNAIEACLRIAEEDKRFIRVYMDMKRKDFYIYPLQIHQPAKRRSRVDVI
jgi:sensor histidine kinase regulating citrate/malate metabolism